MIFLIFFDVFKKIMIFFKPCWERENRFKPSWTNGHGENRPKWSYVFFCWLFYSKYMLIYKYQVSIVGRPGPESPNPGRPGREAFLVVITWESEEKLPFFLWVILRFTFVLWITKPFVQRVSRVVGAILSLTLMFSRFWLKTAAYTVLVATIAANKSEVCPTPATTRWTTSGWVLGSKKGHCFKNIFLFQEKTNKRDNIIFNQVFFFLRYYKPAEKNAFLDG